ncbi:ABC transporter permease [Streptosporangium amethystogenes]|uniref:ABC transporter permease n=1 Tax=Streptosporangium amethystogenes TaxID=2002 RepID=UPI0004C833C5|nr:ABC transporter permease [Streptosporangium amethystogenes]
MTRYLLRRAAQGAFVLWAAFTAGFVILYLLPSDPVEIMLASTGSMGELDPGAVAALRAEYHVDEPFYVQYGIALWRFVQGDFGTSIPQRLPVTELIGQALPETAGLAALAFVIAVLLGGSLALLTGYLRGGRLRRLLLSLPPLLVSIPSFWAGLLLLQVFSFRLGWFPAIGNRGLASLVLPAVTLALPTAAIIAQVLIKSLRQTWDEAFVVTATAKGASRLRILFVDVLRHASLPSLTLVGMTVGNMLAGAIVVETVFSRLGVGRLVEQAVAAQDIPMIQGLVVLSALVFVVVNLVVDAVYPLLDPRIRPSRAVT